AQVVGTEGVEGADEEVHASPPRAVVPTDVRRRRSMADQLPTPLLPLLSAVRLLSCCPSAPLRASLCVPLSGCRRSSGYVFSHRRLLRAMIPALRSAGTPPAILRTTAPPATGIVPKDHAKCTPFHGE